MSWKLQFNLGMVYVYYTAGDCKDENGSVDRCVAGAINNYTTQLLSFDDNGGGASQCISLTYYHCISEIYSLSLI